MLDKYKLKFLFEKLIYILIMSYIFMNLFFTSNNAVYGFYINKDLSKILNLNNFL
jgi:hypothetical protein